MYTASYLYLLAKTHLRQKRLEVLVKYLAYTLSKIIFYSVALNKHFLHIFTFVTVHPQIIAIVNIYGTPQCSYVIS